MIFKWKYQNFEDKALNSDIVLMCEVKEELGKMVWKLVGKIRNTLVLVDKRIGNVHQQGSQLKLF